MPRSLVIGNGSVLATFDEYLQMRDFYFPNVGMEDHTSFGDVHRVGAWVKGKGIAWFDDPSWEIDVQYKPETLVGNTRLRNEKLGIEVNAQDFVHPVKNILVRHFLVHSIDEKEKEVRFFFNHDLHIYGDDQKNTAFYEPYTNSVIHYRQKRYFLVGGGTSNAVQCHIGRDLSPYQSILHSTANLKRCGISSYSVGKAEYRNLVGTWKDAEDGELRNTTIDQGSVDSTVGIHCFVSQEKETSVTMWLCCGKSLEEVIELHQFVLKETPERMQRNCHNYWKSWVNKTEHDFGGLGHGLIDLYKRSLMMIRIHADNEGGIVAAADADIMKFNRDTYTYVWPRDGAFVCIALDKAGYQEVSRRFFDFCCRVQTEDGYLLHKYNPDGSLGSSWHPWLRDNEAQLPIQEDETALVIYSLLKHFESNRDFEFLQDMYERFMKKAATFLCEFREEETGLPLMSYDPWEEHRGIFSYTTACTIAGLQAAATISHILGHYSHSQRYQEVADTMKQAMLFHLYDEDKQLFIKKIKRKNGETTDRDTSPDMSTVAIWKLEVLPINDPRVVSTMEVLQEHLRVQTEIGGYARYTNDVYHSKVGPSKEIPGNPWIITTLWVAQWHIARAHTVEDLQKAKELLEWTAKHASHAGILPEQIHPLTGAPLSVAPLTWSHATYVETVLLYIEKEGKFAS